MIVNCPACKLEQPKDEYCAGCGKSLTKLLAEERAQNKKKVRLAQHSLKALSLCIGLVFLSYFILQSSQKALKSLQASTKPKQRLSLKPMKIRNTFNDDLPKIKKVKRKKQTSVSSKFIKQIKSAPLVVSEKPDLPRYKFETLSLLNLDACPDNIVTSKTKITPSLVDDIISCAKEIFSMDASQKDFVLENPSFSLFVSLKLYKTSFKINYNLVSENYKSQGQKNLPFVEGKLKEFLVWPYENTFDTTEEPPENLLSSYAVKTILQKSFDTAPPPRALYLASFEKTE